jgi:hypothetical protein
VASPAQELVRLVRGGQSKLEGEERTEDEMRRSSFESGVSMEAEFAFAKAVEGFAKQSVKEGTYTGTYNLNLRDQMRLRVRKALLGEARVRILTIGASEVGRIRAEVKRMSDGKAVLGEHIKIQGKLDRKESVRLESVLDRVNVCPDKVVIGGPGNSILESGRKGERGTGAERVVTVRKSREGGVESLNCEFHLKEPTKVTMCDRKTTAAAVGRIVTKCRELWPMTEIYYVGMFPRHVTRCCRDRTHMSDEDPGVIDRSRRDMEEEIRDELTRIGERVERVDWWKAAGMVENPTLDWVRQKRVVGLDGVHISQKYLRVVSAHILHRILDQGEPADKKRRTSE